MLSNCRKHYTAVQMNECCKALLPDVTYDDFAYHFVKQYAEVRRIPNTNDLVKLEKMLTNVYFVAEIGFFDDRERTSQKSKKGHLLEDQYGDAMY